MPWQRCQFHFQKNEQAHVTSVRYRSEAASLIPNIFNAGSRTNADLLIKNTLDTLREDNQHKLADWLVENIDECLTIIDCLPNVQKRIRTSNLMECLNRQIKRRTNSINLFPSEVSLLRVVAAKAIDLSDEWEDSSRLVSISPDKLLQTAEVLKAASSQPSTPAA